MVNVTLTGLNSAFVRGHFQWWINTHSVLWRRGVNIDSADIAVAPGARWEIMVANEWIAIIIMVC